jgi:signal peptidase II
MQTEGRTQIVALVAFLASSLDFATKELALRNLDSNPVKIFGSFLRLHLLFNSGAAFSLAPSATYFFSLFSIFIAILTIYLLQKWNVISRGWQIVAGLILGGITGNLIDRLFRPPYLLRGNVIDWIELPHWPIFNLADSSIFMAALIACILTIRNISPTSRNSKNEPRNGNKPHE